MRNKLSIMLLSMATLGLFSCSDNLTDDGLANKIEDDGNFIYISAGIALPSASGMRSATDEGSGEDGDKTNSDGQYNGKGDGPDYEYGYDYENDVRSMLIVIANKDNQYIAHTLVKGITQAPTTNSKFDFLVNGEIKYADLAAAYEKPADGGDALLNENNIKDVKVYAFCNYTEELLKKFNDIQQGDKTWLDLTGSVEEAASPAGHTPAITNSIWANRSFLMTNAQQYKAGFPEDIAAWAPFADKSTPFELTPADNPILVERTAARFDFRDASNYSENGVSIPNTYGILTSVTQEVTKEEKPDGGYKVTEKTENKNLFSVQLTRMALVNMSKDYYYLRRVSANGTNANWEIGGIETPATITTKDENDEVTVTPGKTPYVVDTDYEKKSNGYYTPETATAEPNIEGGFNFPLFEKNKATGADYYAYNRNGWYVDKIEDVLNNGAEDTWGSTNTYRIWRYVTENTLPNAKDQKTVQSTGVVFKGSIIAGVNFDQTYPKPTPNPDDSVGEGEDEVEGVAEDEVEDEREYYVPEEVRKALTAAKYHYKQAENDETSTNDPLDTNAPTDDKGHYNYPILYSYNNMLYAGVEGLVKGAVKDGKGSPLYMAVEAVLNHWSVSYTVNETSGEIEFAENAIFEYDKTKEEGKKSQNLTVEIYYDILKEKNETGFGSVKLPSFSSKEKDYDCLEDLFIQYAPGNGLTVYKASDEDDGEGWGYYCYYFYWNRHNDNNKSGEMGPMEFATVRNNVYKLAVTKINQLGHPRVTEYDPDPVEPDDPDEEQLRYIQVQVEVLPWVVRVNDIEF